ncbi:hypothetical protein [Nonomuraea sp. NPDC049607]|uniref:hypothetical protein n=1 Tax=Nonomuraea sp. NPDC049607 TaxID=3154732 RepID=UPI003421A91F
MAALVVLVVALAGVVVHGAVTSLTASGHGGPSEEAGWLSRRGAAYGLCQIYRNEPWHYELRPEAAADGCPRKYADPTRDPRMRR